MIEITEDDAVVLMRVCDAVTLKGWASKLAVGKAQRALETGLQPKPVVIASDAGGDTDDPRPEPTQQAQPAESTQPA